MYLGGYTQSAIALELGVSRQQIGCDIQKILGRWRDEMVKDIDEAKSRELRRVDRLEREYWTLYRTNNAPETLARVQWCIEQRCKILGLNAPKVTVGRGEKPKVDPAKPVKEMTDDELEAALTERAVDQVFSDKPVKGGSENEPVKGGCPQDAIPAQPSTDPESIDMPESDTNTATNDNSETPQS